MKKLTLLLAALTVASAAYAKEVMPVAEVEAAPMLKVTSVGQYIEIDNNSAYHDADGDVGTVMLGNKIGLSYGDDWSFDFMARKGWNADTDEGFGSTSSRIDMTAMRDFGDYSLGLKWRQQATYDKFYIKGNYSYGMFSGWADLAYVANEDAADNWYLETMPVKVKYGPVTVGYYLEATETVGSVAMTQEESTAKHQFRISAPIYTADKLSLGAEYRYQFRETKEYKGNNTDWQENNRHIAKLSADYAMTDNLTIDGYYQYDFNKYEGHNGAADDNDDYYGEFCVGWTYKF